MELKANNRPKQSLGVHLFILIFFSVAAYRLGLAGHTVFNSMASMVCAAGICAALISIAGMITVSTGAYITAKGTMLTCRGLRARTVDMTQLSGYTKDDANRLMLCDKNGKGLFKIQCVFLEPEDVEALMEYLHVYTQQIQLEKPKSWLAELLKQKQ